MGTFSILGVLSVNFAILARKSQLNPRVNVPFDVHWRSYRVFLRGAARSGFRIYGPLGWDL